MFNTPYGSIFAPTIQARFGFQRARIAGGLATGQLDPSEAQQLAGADQNIYNQMLADKQSQGYLSLQDRVTLNRELNGTSNDIFQTRHDGDAPQDYFLL